MTKGVGQVTEAEYIKATNLGKLGAALEALRDTMNDGVITEDKRREIIEVVQVWKDKLHKEIKVKTRR